MEPITRTLAAQFMSHGDGHSLKRRGTPIFDIFIRSPVRQTRSYARLKSKKVAMVRRRWVDWSPSEMNCDGRKHWSVVLRSLRKPACQGLRAECSLSHHDRRFAMRPSLSLKSALFGGSFLCLLGPSPFWVTGPHTRAPAQEPAAVNDIQQNRWPPSTPGSSLPLSQQSSQHCQENVAIPVERPTGVVVHSQDDLVHE